MPSNVKVERLDGSILMIGTRRDNDRVELSSVIGFGRLMYMLDHDDALRVAVLYAQGTDFVGGVLDAESWAPVLRTGRFPETPQFVNPSAPSRRVERSHSLSPYRASAKAQAMSFFSPRTSELPQAIPYSHGQRSPAATSRPVGSAGAKTLP